MAMGSAAQIPPGKYLLWTDGKDVFDNEVGWVKLVNVKDSPVNLILSDDAAAVGFGEYGGGEYLRNFVVEIRSAVGR